jgi:hypothetical protein
VLVPAALAPVLETSLALALGAREAAVLGPQVSAPPPFDLFHDLRWVAVYHDSWLSLAGELVGVVALRALWVAWVVSRVRPEGIPRLARAAGRAAVVHAVVAALLVPWIALLFALAVTHISFLFLAALPPVVALALAIHGGGVGAALGRWRWGPTASGLAWTLAAFVWLTVAGAAIGRAPAPVAALASGVAGLANARAWEGIVSGLAGERRVRRRWLAPAAVATTFAVVVAGSAAALAGAHPGAGGATSPAPEGRGPRPVLVAGGLFSRLQAAHAIHLPPGYVVWRFSYRRADGTGRPLPYGPGDTLQPVSVSARLMARQVVGLWRTYGRPVTIVAESEGALVARTYLVRLYPAGSGVVDRLIALSPNAGPARVYFPGRSDEGWGIGSGWALRILARLIEEFLPLDLEPDAPIVRELIECRGRFETVLRAELPPEVEEVSIGALADWVDPVDGARSTDVVVPATHGGLVARADVQRLIGALLRGARPTGAPTLLAEVVAAGAAAWRVPDLPPSLSPERCSLGGAGFPAGA